MKRKFKPLLLVLLFILMITIVGCSKTKTVNEPSKAKVAENKAPTNQEYYTYLSDKYNKYLNGSNTNMDYDIYADQFTYNNTYEEFFTGYNKFYASTQTNLEAFKKDLETGVVKGNAEVDKVNQQIITATDKAIKSVDEYNVNLAEKTKDYGTLPKDQVISGLRTLEKVPYDTRMELNKVINNAKSTLGIK